MGWWSDARRGAAYEFGRRHASAFAAWEVARRLVRLTAHLAVIAALAAGIWTVWRFHTRIAALTGLELLFTVSAGVVLLGVLAALAIRRWAWRVELWLPVEHLAVWLWCAVMLAGSGVATWIWLVAS